MRSKNGDELLAAANPVPDASQLETEAFSIDDVVDRLDSVAPTTEVRRNWGRPLAVAGIAFSLVLAIGAAGALLVRGDDSTGTSNGLVCSDRETDASDTGEFFGSGSYNPFIGIQQSLISNSDEPVFSAQVNGDVATADMYFRLITLETYDGTQFLANQPTIHPLDDLPWIDPCHGWNGPTTPATVNVEIARLRMDWLPAPATPTAWRSANQGDMVQVRREDGALNLGGSLTYAGMQYSIDALIPRLDLQALFADANGRWTPVFAAAAAAGETLPDPRPAQVLRTGPADPQRHLSLPTDTELQAEDLRVLAESVTDGAESAFERGLYLEAWLRSDAFAYATDVETGHELTAITTWLLEPDSPTYHLGYAEHFTTAMAVLARSLEIPSRLVLGFAPGEDIDNATTAVYDRDAHAWVELWIPQHGWVAFDPTPRPADDTTPTYESIGDQLGLDLVKYLMR